MDAVGEPLLIPCGKCLGCRAERARQWGVRIMHEASQHPVNSFLTLSYSPEQLPSDGSLKKEHCQKFIKRLRWSLGSTQIKFFLCGEYGDEKNRPHYHAIIFGEDFVKEPWSRVFSHKTEQGFPIWTSKKLDEVWSHGYCWIGEVDIGSALYCAKYSMKKVYGPGAEAHYAGRVPEFALMSRGGRNGRGIGWSWCEKNAWDILATDSIITNGREARIPRYYDKSIEEFAPEWLEANRKKRVAKADRPVEFKLKGRSYKIPESQNPYRLEARRKIAERSHAAKKQRKGA